MSSEDEDSSITISHKKTLITLPENSNKLTYSMNQFIPKVIIENFPSKRDVMYILKTIFKENNFPEDYTIEDNDNNTFIVNFDNEEAAMSFTKKLNLERIKNPTYKETIVTLTLVPNHHYVPEKKVNKKKGLPIDSIERLFKGESILNKSNQNTSNKKIDKKIYISRHSPSYQNSVPSNILFFLTLFFSFRYFFKFKYS